MSHDLKHLLAAAILATTSTACAVGLDADEGLGQDNDPPLANRDILLYGAPKSDEIPREWNAKADEVLPTKFDLRATQSPVKSQGRRGVCSIFSTTGLMEHLYIKAGTADPDFSEQFLQWSTKTEAGEWPGTSGSTDQANLGAIAQFGTVVEAKWPYEIEQWNASNDPACAPDAEGGDDGLPNKCYTNGEPPAAALSAKRWKLPFSRWLSTSDIKAHIFNNEQAAVVGLDFFYQAWNHRKSTLPVNAANWDKGIVMMPNDDDVTASLEQRAGHAIVLIGWDDEMEVDLLDKDGNPTGEKEKGFYVFKNSWGTTGFGIDNPFGAGYGYISQRYVAEYGSVRASDVPEDN
jgi:hypothetical protein